MTRPLLCWLVGHRWVFSVEGDTLAWGCDRGCAVGGHRRYENPSEAAKRLAMVNRGGRPPLGLLSALAGTVHREPRQPRPER